jgi:DNA-binding transcriptional LysR family regulator
MDVSLGKLHQLVVVARCGTVSQAAAELNISQPALSRSIAAIEARYGFQIFNRSGHGVQPTAAGAQVIALAEPLLEQMRVFDQNLRLFGAGDAGELAFGIAPLLASQLLPRFAAAHVPSGSRARLRVMIRPGADLLAELKRDAIEMFVFPESHIDPGPDLAIERIGTVLPVCVVRAGHPLARQAHVALADLAPFPWASSVDPPAAVAALGGARFTCDNYHVLREATLASDMVVICSSAFVADDLATGALRRIAVAGFDLPPTAIYLATLRGRILSPQAERAVRRIAALLR